MRALLFCLLMTSFSYAATTDSDNSDSPLLSGASKEMFNKENKTIKDAVNKDLMSKETAALKGQAAGMGGSNYSSSDVMIIDPNVVASDWVSAFKALNTRKLGNISFVLRDQSSITDIDSVEAMPGGYLILFTLKTVQGTKYRIIKTGEILSLETK